MSRFIDWNTIYGADGEHDTPYMFRAWIGRLRLHIFYRGDADPDPHDHPWPFWTFPLTTYIEEVTTPNGDGSYARGLQMVEAFRWHYRPATHTHRVIGRMDPSTYELLPALGEFVINDKKIITLVWRGTGERRWGFLKYRDGQWCWTHWKKYVYEGGKHTACE